MNNLAVGQEIFVKPKWIFGKLYKIAKIGTKWIHLEHYRSWKIKKGGSVVFEGEYSVGVAYLTEQEYLRIGEHSRQLNEIQVRIRNALAGELTIEQLEAILKILNP